MIAHLGALIFVGLYLLFYFTKKSEVYNLDPQNKPLAFEPFLARYLRASEFVIGLATGSIVLLIGSSALHGQSGHLPWVYASPLLLLAWCVLYGVVFMVWLILHYEGHQHGDPHTRKAYALAFGYVWLIFAVTR
ncbi:MAG: hypothetical protein ABSD53_12480 [Terriglobales bacterium]